uniref:Uncharacterized protein n=1 Tax=Glossina morsitans morsitans TaxID=37546 RepID=A0A1B0FHF3_GLOMM
MWLAEQQGKLKILSKHSTRHETLGNKAPFLVTAKNWSKKLKGNRFLLSSEVRESRLKSVIVRASIKGVQKLISQGRHMPYRESQVALRTSSIRVYEILHDQLVLQKIFSGFIPHNLLTYVKSQQLTNHRSTRWRKLVMQRKRLLGKSETINFEWFLIICLPEVFSGISGKHINIHHRNIPHRGNASLQTCALTTDYFNGQKSELGVYPPVPHLHLAANDFSS